MTGIGLCLPQLGPHVTADVIAEFARRAERLGYCSLWVQDHFMYPLRPERGYGGSDVLPPTQYTSVYAPLETLAFVAGQTRTMNLGTSILVAGNHWPVPLAQRLATLDQMCGGRLIVGLGVGWNAEEHRASGTDIETRGRRMDDFIPALLACWGDDPVSYDGPVFRIPPSRVNPKPLRRPLLLSGMWSEAGLERTARWFDAWNPAGMSVSRVQKMAAGIDSRRSAGQKPIQIYLRLFAQDPLGPPRTLDEILSTMTESVRAAREAGFEEVTLEHNFWDAIESPEDWSKVPELFASLLDT
ncbi:MAG: TIGR03619 family F420-dependent LLM class oxidoreductase [Actinomycetota bacterium]